MQHAEVYAARLAICHSLKEGHKIVRIYSDSWCLCNGIAIWPPKWQQSDWKLMVKIFGHGKIGWL
jgi:ribonuclease HI